MESNADPVFSRRIDGTPGAPNFAAHVEHRGRMISIWNDVPLFGGQASERLLHFVCEVPANTRDKMEIQTDRLPHTPIMQDRTADGSLRCYHYAPMPCNYGALPQTWEDPARISPHTGVGGDGDPLDVLEIGAGPLPIASISPVKVLGALAMVDGGETDWKLVAIRTSDALAPLLNDIGDVERRRPGLLGALRKWLAEYKTADGKPLNTFGCGGAYQPRDVAMRVVQECHADWRSLL